MVTRIKEGFGGGRVYDGSEWMELYWALNGWLSGDPAWSLTGNGKIPNGYSSMNAELLIDVVFDSNTLDNSNTFTQNGTSWPYQIGSVPIPTVPSARCYQKSVLVYPKFGEETNLNAKASLTGIDRIPGTTSFDRTITFPARAWAAPDSPTITSVKQTGTQLRLSISGHQLTTTNDKYWGETHWTIRRGDTGLWTETHGQAANKTFFDWSVLDNEYYRVGAYASNADADTRNWAFYDFYTKPAAPIITVARQTSNKTRVNVTINNQAKYPDRHRVYRWSNANGAWVEVGSIIHGPTNVLADTVPLGTNPSYLVTTETPGNAAVSNNSNMASAGDGYDPPLAPSNVTLTQVGTELRTTFSGNQTNTTVDGYWDEIHLEIQKDSGSFIHYVTETNNSATEITTSGYGVTENSRYLARVRAWNTGGFGPYGTSGYVYTKPTAPSAVAAARVGETETVNISFTVTAAWPGQHRIFRSIDGGAPTLLKTLAAGVTSTTDTLAASQSATYTVQTEALAGGAISDSSPASPLVPSVAYDKDRIPGIDAIRVGGDKVFRVMAGTEQIWLG